MRGSTLSWTGCPLASTQVWVCGGGERNPTRQVAWAPESRHSTMTATDRRRQPCALAQRRLTVATMSQAAQRAVSGLHCRRAPAGEGHGGADSDVPGQT